MVVVPVPRQRRWWLVQRGLGWRRWRTRPPVDPRSRRVARESSRCSSRRRAAAVAAWPGGIPAVGAVAAGQASWIANATAADFVARRRRRAGCYLTQRTQTRRGVVIDIAARTWPAVTNRPELPVFRGGGDETAHSVREMPAVRKPPESIGNAGRMQRHAVEGNPTPSNWCSRKANRHRP